jgi:hypothetical protein
VVYDSTARRPGLAGRPDREMRPETGCRAVASRRFSVLGLIWNDTTLLSTRMYTEWTTPWPGLSKNLVDTLCTVSGTIRGQHSWQDLHVRPKICSRAPCVSNA